MASTDAMPVPKKGVAYRHYFALRNTDGTLCTSWAGQDTELSKDGGAFADATNEATEIGISGCGYVDLTAAETDYDAVMVKVTVTNTDALPYVVTLFPEEAGDIRANATQISGDSTAADILELFVEALKAETGQIDNGTFAAGAIDASAIATGAIDADALAADCITSAKIADDAIGDEHWNVTSVDADLTDAAKLAIQQIAAGANACMLLDTTIATLSSQTSFTLTAGSDQDDAYNRCTIVLYDATNNDYPSMRHVSDYTGATKTVTLNSGADFTAAVGDGVKIFAVPASRVNVIG